LGEPYPEWLQPLLDNMATVRPEDISRFLPPVGGGRASAVLVLFGEGPAGPDLLLTQRAASMNSHAGQPAFPGGSADPGDDGPVGTALREAREEVGLDPSGVYVLGTLPVLHIPVSGFDVTPVLAWWHTPHAVVPVSASEVAVVERVPLAELTDPANRCVVRSPSGFSSPAFTVRGMVVWGFTAFVLDAVLSLGEWARPWDRSVVRDLP
jgi:8-oxo-dGTP pyrophosphatase MutT (NUDIX family)